MAEHQKVQEAVLNPLAPALRDEFGYSVDDHIYMVPHPPHKFHPDYDNVIGEILLRDPKAKLALCLFNAKKHQNALAQLKLRLLGLNVVAANWGRVRFFEQMGFNKLLSFYATADVLLDPFPYGGGVTSIDAFAIGAPIVTAPSLSAVMPLTAGMYRRMGITELIARKLHWSLFVSF